MNTERPCPVCHSNSYTPFLEERVDPNRVGALTYASRKPPEFMCLRLVCCTVCDLIYAPEPPTEDFLHNAYAEASFDSGPEAEAAAKTYANTIESHVKCLDGRRAAVDVGAGSGPLLPWLQNQGFSPVIGIEPSQAAINAAPSGIRPLLRQGMFSPGILENETPSLICSFMTLEHLPDPGAFFSTAYDLLEPEGMLAVVVHNWRAPLNRLLGARSPIIDVEHLQLFSPQALRELFQRTGFKRIELKPLRNTYPLRYWLRLTPLPAPIKHRFISLLERLGLANINLSINVGNMLAVGIKPNNDHHADQPTDIKQNVHRFDDDVREQGAYAYTGDRLSSRFANARISCSIAESFDFRNTSVLDLGCGDGAYTLEFAALGVRQVVGIDPASVAIDAARSRSQAHNVDNVVKFEVGNIYELDEYLLPGRFDCIVIRGVLHHLPDPARALAGLAAFQGTVIVLEPNGNNPVLKLLERFSRYHIEHEERSFRPRQIRQWLTDAGYPEQSCKLINLVPFFCPTPMAKVLRLIEPIVERIPLLRDITCGQSIIVARK